MKCPIVRRADTAPCALAFEHRGPHLFVTVCEQRSAVALDGALYECALEQGHRGRCLYSERHSLQLLANYPDEFEVAVYTKPGGELVVGPLYTRSWRRLRRLVALDHPQRDPRACYEIRINKSEGALLLTLIDLPERTPELDLAVATLNERLTMLDLRVHGIEREAKEAPPTNAPSSGETLTETIQQVGNMPELARFGAWLQRRP